MPGRQTVPRAELNAILEAMRTAPPQRTLRCHPDATYVARALPLDAEERRRKHHAGNNGDLWREYDSLLEAKGTELAAERVPAHVSTTELVAGARISLVGFAGNLLADAAAGEALGGGGWEHHGCRFAISERRLGPAHREKDSGHRSASIGRARLHCPSAGPASGLSAHRD